MASLSCLERLTLEDIEVDSARECEDLLGNL